MKSTTSRSRFVSGVTWDLCGCDMARKATWKCHVDPRKHLSGMEVARTRDRATRVHADARVAPTWRESDWAGE